MLRHARAMFPGAEVWPIATIDPNAKKGTRSTVCKRIGIDEALTAANLTGRNIYIMSARPVEAWEGENPPTKQEVPHCCMLQADVDFRVEPGSPADGIPPVPEDRAEGQARVLKLLADSGLPPPTIAWFTGNGMQFAWLLREPIPAADAEVRNKWIAKVLGGDSTQNCNRLMRLAGTINWPTKKKKEDGKTPVMAGLAYLEHHPERVYGRDDFKTLDVTPKGSAVAATGTGTTATASASGDDGPEVELDRDKVDPHKYDDLADLPQGFDYKARLTLGWTDGNLATLSKLHADEGWGWPNDVPYPKNDKPLEHDASNMSHHVICSAVRAGMKPHEIASLVLRAESRPAFKHIFGQHDKWRAIARSITKAKRDVAAQRRSAGDERALICHDDNRRDAVMAKIGEALKDVPIYQRSGRLVHPVRTDKPTAEDDGIRRPEGALVIVELVADRLSLYMTKHINFIRGYNKEGVPLFDGPGRAPRVYLSYTDGWPHQVLHGVVESPTMREDGTIVEAEGFDKASGLMLDFRGVKFPSVPDRPTRDQALKALASISHVLRGFPFDGEDEKVKHSPSRSVALSGILTALCRRTLPAAPCHAYDAPKRGTGKTKLANIPHAILTGKKATCISQAKDEAEDEKRIFAALLAGDQTILYDNVTRPFGNQHLNTILSEESWSSRLLGVNQNIPVKTNALLQVTGNNLEISGDLVRRVIKCRLNANEERPETRTFDFDVDSEVLANRPALVAAGLTVLRAWEVAKADDEKVAIKPLGSFERWSDRVRAALVWLGEADPCDTYEDIIATDTEHEMDADIFSGLYGAFKPNETLTARTIYDEARCYPESPLANALNTKWPQGPSLQRIGKWLGHNKDGIIDGLQLKHVGRESRGEYRVVAAKGGKVEREEAAVAANPVATFWGNLADEDKAHRRRGMR